MQDHDDPIPSTSKRSAWNKGKLMGAKPPLRPKHVWSIRTKLQVEGRTRDLAMFNLAIEQAAWLRCRCPQGRGHCTEWVRNRSSDGTTDEDRAARQVRTDGADPAGGR
jgi:hypothetical protein